MTKFSEIISLPVYSIFDRKKIGNIENILLNKNHVKYYVVYDEENDIKYLLHPSKIFGHSPSCITIKNLQVLLLLDSEDKNISNYTNPINSTLISTKGESYGKIRDIVIEDNTAKEIICDYIVSFNKVLSLGDKVSFVKHKDSDKMSLYAHKKPVFKDIKEFKVVAQNSVAPLREIVNNNMLIGRKTTQDILGLNNEIIVKSGSIINSKILNKVKYSGKLKELTLYSK